jgi:subtilisin family serine protease
MFGLTSACATTEEPLALSHEESSDVDALVHSDGSVVTFQALADTITAVTIESPSTSLDARLTDPELVLAVARSGGQVFIGFKNPTDPPTRLSGRIPAMSRSQALIARAAAESLGARLVQTYKNSATIVAEIDPRLAPILRKHNQVSFIEPVGTGRLLAATQQDTSWGIRKTQVDRAWLQGYHGQGVFVTILDSGMDDFHAFNPAGDGPANLPVFDCIWVNASWAGGNCFSGGFFHGAHVAGIIAAENNAYGVIGAAYAPAATASIKVCNPANGRCLANDLVAGLDWTASAANSGRRPQVVNMSLFVDDSTSPFGSPNYLAVSEAIQRSWQAGNLLVAGAGNDGANVGYYPAAYNQVISVSGTTETDAFAFGASCPATTPPSAFYSNYHSTVGLSAPFYSYSLGGFGSYQYLCGTSMSTALVSGVAAVVWSKFPSWTNAQIKTRLQQTAVDLGSSGRDSYFGYGRVDAYCALNNIIPCAEFGVMPNAPGLVTVKGTYQLTATATHPATNWQWDRSDDGGANWYLWANAQNTQFLASAGNYTINWRVSATRSADGHSATVYATTVVCTSGGPSCLQ